VFRIGKAKKNNKDQESSEYRIKSLAPDERLDDDYSKMYYSYLDDFIANPLVNNIAITGDYGIGKSTIIHNYENTRANKPWAPKKFAYLSVTDLNLHSEDNEEQQDRVEVRLLKQLLVICNKDDIHGSHFRPVPENKSILIPILLTLTGVIIAAAKFGLINEAVNNPLYIILLILLCGYLIFYSIKSIYKHYNLPSFEFTFGNSDNNSTIQTGADDEKETLDSHLTDIVYLMETVYKKTGGILVIEDIDRYEIEICIPVLEKLREINTLINQRLRFCKLGEQTFKFIYLLKDDIFSETDNNRNSTPVTKFFDGVIPVVPRIGNTNSYDYLSEIWSSYHLSNSFINKIAPFIFDFRKIRAIENEFNIFLTVTNAHIQVTDESKKNTEIMALSIYKFFFPNEYYQIRKDSSNELISYLIKKRLNYIYATLKTHNYLIEEYSPPQVPDNEIKAILFENMSLDVLKYLFPNSTITEIMKHIDELDNYIMQLNENVSHDKAHSIIKRLHELLNGGGIYTEDFELLISYYESQLFGIDITRNSIKKQLIKGIEKGDIIMYYQPIFTIEGDLYGVEALCRMRFQNSLVPPSSFIPLIMSHGLEHQFNIAVISKIISDITSDANNYLKETQLFINIFISQDNKTIDEFCSYLNQMIIENRIKKSNLNIEFTEGEFIKYNSIEHFTNQINDLGISLWLDDFGIGFTSINGLISSHLAGVKIDNSIVEIHDPDGVSVHSLALILSMCQKLGIKSIAEGIETKQQLSILKDKKCDYYQGYYFSRPLSFEELISFINNHKRLST